MTSAPGQVLRLQIQCLERGQILFTQASELVEELLERLALTLFHLRKAVKGIKWSRLAVFQDDPRPRHPVGALPDDQVPYDVERAPGVVCFVTASFVAAHPDAGQPAQQRI